MSTLVRVTLAVVEVLAAGALGAMAGRGGRAAASRSSSSTRRKRRRSNASGRWWRRTPLRRQAVVRALSAHMSLRARLVAVSDSALEHAQALERLQEAGMAPRGVRANADWRPPPRALARPPTPRRARGLAGARPVLRRAAGGARRPGASCVEHARAYTAVGRAARQVADGLAGATALELAAGCSFCAKRRQDVRRLIAGPGIYICDECVALCVEVMEEEVGPDWREEADRRLRGEDDEDE